MIVELISDLDELRGLLSLCDEFVVNTFLDKNSGSSDATLAMIKVNTKLRLFNRKIYIGVVQNNIWRFASKLQCYPFEIVLVSISHDAVTNLS